MKLKSIIKAIILLGGFLIYFEFGFTQALKIVAVGRPEIEKEKISILPILRPDNLPKHWLKEIEELDELFLNDFNFYRSKFIVPDYRVTNVEYSKDNFGKPNLTVWKKKNSHYLVQFMAQYSVKEGLSIKYSLFNVFKGNEIFTETIKIKNPRGIRKKGHFLADRIYHALTGKKSIFNSKITFVSDVTGMAGNVNKELYMMDFDGRNIRKLTNHKSIVISPAVSPDYKRIVYSLIRPGKVKKNVDLYYLNLKTMKSEVLSSRKGLNSGAVFLPDGESILFTLSFTGNADLYLMNLQTRKLNRITHHWADDVDPSISINGKQVSFLSGRSGPPMIYTLELNPETQTANNIKRISFVGKYNATPRFSPDGSEIAFASWLDNSFDIFRVKADGSELVRLTKNFGSNESPSYSPDGEFIAFSSQRVLSKFKAVQNIYIMDRNGEILGSVTDNFGNCISPRWSN